MRENTTNSNAQNESNKPSFSDLAVATMKFEAWLMEILESFITNIAARTNRNIFKYTETFRLKYQ